jgi:hypothetical protein
LLVNVCLPETLSPRVSVYSVRCLRCRWRCKPQYRSHS